MADLRIFCKNCAGIMASASSSRTGAIKLSCGGCRLSKEVQGTDIMIGALIDLKNSAMVA